MTSLNLKAFLLVGLIQISLLQNITDSFLNVTTSPTIRQTIILTYPYKISGNKINNFLFKNKNKIDSLKHIESNENTFETKFNYLNKNETYKQDIQANESLNFDLIPTDVVLSTSKINLISNYIVFVFNFISNYKKFKSQKS